MPRVTKISTSLIMFFLFSVLYLATMVHAQPVNPDCKDIANKMVRGDIKINKIQRQMKNAIGNVYGEDNKHDWQGKKLENQNKLLDRHNRHINILVHNLGRHITSMTGLLEYAKQQGNSCQEMVKKISGTVNAIQDIHAKMERSLSNKNTSQREFQGLIKNLKQ